MNENITYPDSYVVWDLETSGLDPEKDRILEIGCMTVENGQPIDQWSMLLNYGIDIPEEVSKIHGITKEMCEKEGVDPAIGLRRLVNAILASQANVTHNGTKFDHKFLLQSIHRELIGLDHKDKYAFSEYMLVRSIDTAAIFKARKLGINRRWDQSPYDFAKVVLDIRAYGVKFNIPTCCADLGINTAGLVAHRTAGDIEMTNQIYKKLIAS